MELRSNPGVGLGWVRAMAQGYNYSYCESELGSNFQNNLNRLVVKLGWGLDGCALWRDNTVTVAIHRVGE